MKKLLVALAAAGALTSPAFAGPCVALDYQEMKDMPTDELAKEFCKAGDERSTNMDEVLSNLRVTNGPKPFPTASDNFDQCDGQMTRIQRVLQSKGMDKQKVDDFCMARTDEKKPQIIERPIAPSTR